MDSKERNRLAIKSRFMVLISTSVRMPPERTDRISGGLVAGKSRIPRANAPVPGARSRPAKRRLVTAARRHRRRDQPIQEPRADDRVPRVLVLRRRARVDLVQIDA